MGINIISVSHYNGKSMRRKFTWDLTCGIDHQCHQEDEPPQWMILHDTEIAPQGYISLRPEKNVS